MLLELLASSPGTPAPIRDALRDLALADGDRGEAARERSLHLYLADNPATPAHDIAALDRGTSTRRAVRVALRRPDLSAAEILELVGTDTSCSTLTGAALAADWCDAGDAAIFFDQAVQMATGETFLAGIAGDRDRVPRPAAAVARATERLAAWPEPLMAPAIYAVERRAKRAVASAATKADYDAAVAWVAHLAATTTRPRLVAYLTNMVHEPFTDPEPATPRWFATLSTARALAHLHESSTSWNWVAALEGHRDPTGALASAAMDSTVGRDRAYEARLCEAVLSHSRHQVARARAAQLKVAASPLGITELSGALRVTSLTAATLTAIGNAIAERTSRPQDNALWQVWCAVVATHPNATRAQRVAGHAGAAGALLDDPEEQMLLDFAAHTADLDPDGDPASAARAGWHLPLSPPLHTSKWFPGLAWLAAATIAERLAGAPAQETWQALVTLDAHGFTGTLGQALDTAVTIATP